MTLKQKCDLYFLIYAKLWNEHKSRGDAKFTVATKAMLHREAFQRTNYCLAVFNESITLKEIYEHQKTEAA